jgi:hypothetical protein
MNLVGIDEKLENEFSSMRIINTLTPDTFMRKIIVISTMFRSKEGRETAIKQEEALNHTTIDLNSGEWKILKTHTNLQEAIKFHFEVVNSKKFIDCEKC